MPQEVVARAAIGDALARYHLAGDRGRYAEMAAIFTEDGVLELPQGPVTGRRAIASAMSGEGRPAPVEGASSAFIQHHLTTSRVEVTGDGEARGWSSFLVMSPAGVDHCGRYADTFREVEGVWLIARRKVAVLWTSPTSVYTRAGGGD